MIDKTVEYYNENAQNFFETTVNADMSLQLNDFIKLLPAEGCVLDAGCGSGRDSLVLIKSGFKVDAFDASEEMCKRASNLLGQRVRFCRFEELRDIMNAACEKLKQWTEEEFRAFDFSPYLFEEDDEDES